jgi:hypothetical protein
MTSGFQHQETAANQALTRSHARPHQIGVKFTPLQTAATERPSDSQPPPPSRTV